jgi:hypothetical protein
MQTGLVIELGYLLFRSFQGYLNQTVHSIEITPAMKKAVMKTGQPISRNMAPPAFDWRKTVLDGTVLPSLIYVATSSFQGLRTLAHIH